MDFLASRSAGKQKWGGTESVEIQAETTKAPAGVEIASGLFQAIRGGRSPTTAGSRSERPFSRAPLRRRVSAPADPNPFSLFTYMAINIYP